MTLQGFRSLEEGIEYKIGFKENIFLDYHLSTKRHFVLYAVSNFFC